MPELVLTSNRGSETVLSGEHLSQLRAELRGQLLLRGDPGYDDARRVHNGMIDRHPAMVVRSAGTADVIRAVRLAAEHDLRLAVRGGGHGVPGFAVCDGGLMLDLSLMKDVRVDPTRRTARAGGGVTWGDFDLESQAHVVLYTLGGAVNRVPDDATAVAHRDARHILLALGMWERAEADKLNRGWVREFWTATERFSSGGFYPNYESEVSAERLSAAFGPVKFARLAALRAKHDPANLFRLNGDIRTTTSVPR